MITKGDDVLLVQMFSKGLNDHCRSATPKVTKLIIDQTTVSVKNSNNCLFWLTQANCWTNLKEMEFHCKSSVSIDYAHNFFKKLVELQFLYICIPYWKWLSALKCFSDFQLNGFHIDAAYYPHHLQLYNCSEAILDIVFPSFNIKYGASFSINTGINALLKSILRSNKITSMILSNISRETMAGVRNILLHCPSLTTLELKRTRLGYDGILYIFSALKNNTKLTHLLIHDDLQFPRSRNSRKLGDVQFTSFLSMKRVPLPGKTTCTDFLLELNNILKDNTTLKEMKIQSGLFLPLSAGVDEKYCQWTGLGTLQQFNMGAIGSGVSPSLRRSFSSSDLTQPQATLFWDKQFHYSPNQSEVDFKKLFAKRKEEGKKLFSLPSFTAPDTEVLQSFSGLDPRLKKCLKISHLHQYVKRVRKTCWGILNELSSHWMQFEYSSEHSDSDD